ncbi:hypothetical protein MLD38_038747 [Melastoma candidum]|uniref:Uncharacterized protein n=1 Tax=Melastoma candidum TaxID=119954 RepID=A0ACB9KZV4_9MYRT|nr:hypothetical protein MLD38_038747 [Melastoma candidum]
MAEVMELSRLLDATLGFDGTSVRAAADALDGLSSSLPRFPFHLLSIAMDAGGKTKGVRIAAAAYLKNYAGRNLEREIALSIREKDFKDQLMDALLRVEPEILKLLVEVLRLLVDLEFVKQNSWPELIPNLKLAIQESDFFSKSANCHWKTVNAFTMLQVLIRPFQYYLNPKVAVESVPAQLELLSEQILAPLLPVFHSLTGKVSLSPDIKDADAEKILLIICKCMYFAMRSHLPSVLVPCMASFSEDLIRILNSLSLDSPTPSLNLLRLKTGKRSLLIFCSLVTRHRKHSDRLMSCIVNCSFNLVKWTSNLSKLDFPAERIVSLAFDVISHILETGPGWKIVSPWFSSLLDAAIFPALMMNEKDLSEWEEDASEYLRKNLPSDFEEISGWREDLFTVRKSALNLLGVISSSKGPPVGNISSLPSSSKRKKAGKNKTNGQRSLMGELLVLPFLSKYPVPSDANICQPNILNNYFAVLMAYAGLQDFFRVGKPGYITTLLQVRVLPLYSISGKVPYLIATANWLFGELATCLPEDMNSDVYSSLLKALTMPDLSDTSCYPVRASAAGVIAKLVENDYPPPDWLQLLQVIVARIGSDDDESCILFQLLSCLVETASESVHTYIPDMIPPVVNAIMKFLPSDMEPWPQVVEKGFASIAVMAQSWRDSTNEDGSDDRKMASSSATIGRSLSCLLQKAWLNKDKPTKVMDEEADSSVPSSCIYHSSTLLQSIILSASGNEAIRKLKLSELLLIWADQIADWNSWEESEDLSVFGCINEVIRLSGKYELSQFFSRYMPSPPAPPIPPRSIIEGIGAFICEAISRYPSATQRACSCVHAILHVPPYSDANENVKLSLVVRFSQTAFSHYRSIQSDESSSVQKSLLLVIASCYLCYPHMVEDILAKNDNGFASWASAFSSLALKTSERNLSGESELKLFVMAMVKVTERLLEQRNPAPALVHGCLTSLMEATVCLNVDAADDENDEGTEEENDDYDDDDEDEETDDEDSEDDEREETHEEFLERYAKAAADLENGITVSEGDADYEDNEPELGSLGEVDCKQLVLEMIQRHRNTLANNTWELQPELVRTFMGAFQEDPGKHQVLELAFGGL